MRKELFTGACTALVTPFLDGNVNYPMLEQLIRHQLDAGIKAIVLAGTTGESATLTDEEKLEMIRRAKAYTGDDAIIIAGTGSNSTAHAARLSFAAEEAGADGLLIVSPYYNKATAEGLFAHYLTIAKTVSIPIIAYNVPGRTGVDMSVSVYERLNEIPNMVGIKEAATDITKITRICRSCDKLTVWSGNDDHAVAAIALGAKGVISVLSNVLPMQTQAMAQAALDGDFDTAAALQQDLQPLVDLLFAEVNPIPVKAAMKYMGFDCGDCRLPLTELSRENRMKLQKYLT